MLAVRFLLSFASTRGRRGVDGRWAQKRSALVPADGDRCMRASRLVHGTDCVALRRCVLPL